MSAIVSACQLAAGSGCAARRRMHACMHACLLCGAAAGRRRRCCLQLLPLLDAARPPARPISSTPLPP
jgi:hypothetical protein